MEEEILKSQFSLNAQKLIFIRYKWEENHLTHYLPFCLLLMYFS
jgi:hypothetical protein